MRKLADIVLVDLIERTISPGVGSPIVLRPVVRIRRALTTGFGLACLLGTVSIGLAADPGTEPPIRRRSTRMSAHRRQTGAK